MCNGYYSNIELGSFVVDELMRELFERHSPELSRNDGPCVRRFQYPPHSGIHGIDKSRSNFLGSLGIPIARFPIVLDG
jgi:hypothetical protein